MCHGKLSIVKPKLQLFILNAAPDAMQCEQQTLFTTHIVSTDNQKFSGIVLKSVRLQFALNATAQKMPTSIKK